MTRTTRYEPEPIDCADDLGDARALTAQERADYWAEERAAEARMCRYSDAVDDLEALMRAPAPPCPHCEMGLSHRAWLRASRACLDDCGRPPCELHAEAIIDAICRRDDALHGWTVGRRS